MVSHRAAAFRKASKSPYFRLNFLTSKELTSIFATIYSEGYLFYALTLLELFLHMAFGNALRGLVQKNGLLKLAGFLEVFLSVMLDIWKMSRWYLPAIAYWQIGQATLILTICSIFLDPFVCCIVDPLSNLFFEVPFLTDRNGCFTFNVCAHFVNLLQSRTVLMYFRL